MRRTLLFGLFLTGCTSLGIEENAQTWIGSSEDELVSSWGPPDNVHETDGYRYLTYDRGMSDNVVQVGGVYQRINNGCELTFMVLSAKIRDVTARGKC